MEEYDERIAKIKEVIANEKEKAFVASYEASDAEAMGLVIAKGLEWDGKQIIEACCYALEDANYHIEMREIRNKYLGGVL